MTAADRDIAEPTARLLNQVAIFLNAKADYRSAEPLMCRAWEIFDESLGSEHPNTIGVRKNFERLLKELEK